MLALQKTSMEYFPTILTCAEHIAILEALLFKLVKENDTIHLFYNNHFVRFIACNSALVTLNTLVCINAPIECSTLPMFKRMLPAVGYPNSQKQLLACIQDVNCRGVILSGPSGKKVIANNVVVNMARLTLFYFHLSEECVFLDTADSNTPLERFLGKVIRAIPCVLLLDGLDLIAPGFADHDHNSFATHVMKLLKTIKSSRITVIASCKSSAKLSKSFLPNRNGFFTSEVHLPRMNATERLEMIENTFMRYGLTDTGDISQNLAIDTAGWVTRDLELFLKTILDDSFSIKMDIAKSPDEDMVPLIARLASLEITPPKLCWNTIQAKKTIFELGIEKVSFESHIKRNSWSNIAGYTKQIEQIKRLLFWPHTHRATFERLGIKESSGILLYGPSGCGKTFLAQALASNSILNFVSASPADIFSKYLGDSEQNIKELFQYARSRAPCILFLDNFEAIGTKRNLNDDSSSGVHERVLSTLLNEMDGIVDSTGVVFLACTNQPWDLDDALLRPGRIDHKIYIPLPEESDRLAILQLLANKSQIQMSDEEYQTLVDKSNGQTPALLNCAFRKAETNSNAKIEHAHLVQALDELMQRYQPPSVTKFITFGDR